MRKASVAGLILAFALAGTTLSGCSALASNGPLDLTGEGDEVCLPVPMYNDIAFGVDLPNNLSERVTFDSVQLVNPVNIKLDGVRLMPITYQSVLAQPYPPNGKQAADWANSVPAIGAKVGPNGARYVMVLRVMDPTNRTGGSDGVLVNYTAGGLQWTTRTFQRLDMHAKKCN